MRKQDGGYDYHRYRQLLAEADDEKKRLALIELLIQERAKDRLAAERASDHAATTAMTIARVLGTSAPRDKSYSSTSLKLAPLRLVRNPRQADSR